MKPASLASVATIVIATAFAPQLRAADITGSISIEAFEAALSTGTFAAMSSITPAQPSILLESGVYTGAPLLTPVTFNTLQFDAPASDSPVWTFVVGEQTYSFDVTSIDADYDSGLHQWDLGGNGIATVSGYNPTPATWTMNLNQDGGPVVFDAVANNNADPIDPAAAIPESSTFALMSIGLVTLAGIGRRGLS
jgi:hypothetical protein